MKYYVVIDTNVLSSAILNWDSVPGNILELTFRGTIVPLLNDKVIKEYREVLSRPKFHLTQDIVEGIVGELERLGQFIDAEELDVYFMDANDRMFYEIAVEERKSRDTYLVTSNIRHFRQLPFVVTPRQMLDIIIRNIEGIK